jgi:hypothetical protein
MGNNLNSESKLTSIILLSLFMICLCLGIGIGGIMRGGILNSKTSPTEISAIQPVQKTKILIIGVDTLSSPLAKLESAWLVTFEGGSLELELKSYYPVRSDTNLYSYQIPHQPILITTGNFEALRLNDIFTKQNVDWTDVVIIDEFMLDTIVELVGTNHPSPPNPNNPIAGSLTKVWEDPEGAYLQQENLLIFLCAHSSPFSNLENILSLLGFMPDHMRSTLSTDDLMIQWQLWSNKNFEIVCSFPE